VNFVLTLISWTVMITWVSVALGGLTYWFWSIFLPNTDQDWYLSRWFFGPTDANFETLDTILYFVLGLVFAATLPFITRGFTLMHYYVAVALLGSFASDLLRRQVGDLAASRSAAVSAEGHSLRRLERDIHDGPQQRLVRLQMDLAAAERQLDKDPEKARGLINEAMLQSKDALEELRSLSRGFSPPILLDRGLVAALESVADRNTVPTRIESTLGDVVVPQEVERNAYFVATEALANAAKHSGATEVVVSLTASDTWLVVSVTDNGAGGAVVTPDHGLAGLEERLRGLGGSIELSSPAGGPTVLAARLPLGATVADA
jgi:signal transduction histidine kinase